MISRKKRKLVFNSKYENPNTNNDTDGTQIISDNNVYINSPITIKSIYPKQNLN